MGFPPPSKVTCTAGTYDTPETFLHVNGHVHQLLKSTVDKVRMPEVTLTSSQ